MARICSVTDCDRNVRSDDLCQTHVIHVRRYGEPREIRKYARLKIKTEICALPHCSHLRYSAATIFCKAHTTLARNYNIAHEELVRLYILGCSICGEAEGSLAVDHDHACCPQKKKSCGDCVRGVLCSDCNFLMGWVDKILVPRPELFDKISDYLNARTETTHG